MSGPSDEQIRQALENRGLPFDRYADVAVELAGGPSVPEPPEPPTEADRRARVLQRNAYDFYVRGVWPGTDTPHG